MLIRYPLIGEGAIAVRKLNCYRAFVRLRQLLSVHKELAERLMKLEEQVRQRDHTVAQQFQKVFALLDQLFSPPRKAIGFHAKEPDKG